MCGIAGAMVIGKKGKQVTSANIIAALEETSTRGMDATGFWSPSTGVVKDGLKASDFVKAYEVPIIEASQNHIWIGHTRAATAGKHGEAPPTKNENNHPFETERWVLVHNGVIRDTPEIKGYKYNGACDSEVVISLIETFGIEKGLSYILQQDSASLVIYDKQENLLYFWRTKNPLCYSFDADNNVLLFGSTVDIIDAMCDIVDMAGFTFYTRMAAGSTDEHHLYTISPEKGLISKTELKPAFLYKLKESPDWSRFDVKEEVPFARDFSAGYPNGNRIHRMPSHWDAQRKFAISGAGDAPIVSFAAVMGKSIEFTGRIAPGTSVGCIREASEFLKMSQCFYPTQYRLDEKFGWE